MRPWGFWLAFLLAIAATTAQADIHACTDKEYDDASFARWNEDGHQLFQIPPITYDRPKTSVLGIDMVFVVGEDGQIVCLNNGDLIFKALKETPERRALLAQMETWRFKPFLKKGEPVQTRTNVYVPEKVEFQFHEDMPSAPASDMTIAVERSACLGPCPGYSVTLHGGGSVDYDGRWNTVVRGKYVYPVDPARIATLMEALKTNDVWSMSGNWVGLGSDLSASRMDITIGNEHRHFEDFFGFQLGMPKALSDFMDEVDKVSRSGDFNHLSTFAVTTLENEGFAFRSQEGADLFFRAVNDDDISDDAPLLRLIELGVPALDGQSDDYTYNWPTDPPLVAALRNRHAGVIEPLISMGALDTAGKPDQTKIDAAFQAAIAGGRLAAVERIWQVAETYPHPSLTVTEKDYSGKTIQFPVTLLLRRAQSDQAWEGLQIAQWLAAQGCDLRARGPNGKILLNIAAETDDIPMVKYLLAQGIDADTPGSYNSSALGSVDDDEDLAMLLIEAGADPWKLEADRYGFMAHVKNSGWTRVLAWMEAHRPQGQDTPPSHN